eukprot:jgi/Orpsp1_1/1181940/evm.model.c7180000079206.1
MNILLIYTSLNIFPDSFSCKTVHIASFIEFLSIISISISCNHPSFWKNFFVCSTNILVDAILANTAFILIPLF